MIGMAVIHWSIPCDGVYQNAGDLLHNLFNVRSYTCHNEQTNITPMTLTTTTPKWIYMCKLLSFFYKKRWAEIIDKCLCPCASHLINV